MNGPSAIPAMVDALVECFTAAAAAGGYSVYDGPGVTDDSPGTYVLVGVEDPDGEGLGQVATSDQSWPFAGHFQRAETGSIRNVIVSWTGDTDMKGRRDAAYALLGVLASALEADPAIGAPNQVLWSTGLKNIEYRQIQDDNGAMAVILFEVGFEARLEMS